jgi:hypothetical protein
MRVLWRQAAHGSVNFLLCPRRHDRRPEVGSPVGKTVGVPNGIRTDMNMAEMLDIAGVRIAVSLVA